MWTHLTFYHWNPSTSCLVVVVLLSFLHTYPLSLAWTSAPCCSNSWTILTLLYPAARWSGVDCRQRNQAGEGKKKADKCKVCFTAYDHDFIMSGLYAMRYADRCDEFLTPLNETFYFSRLMKSCGSGRVKMQQIQLQMSVESLYMSAAVAAQAGGEKCSHYSVEWNLLQEKNGKPASKSWYKSQFRVLDVAETTLWTGLRLKLRHAAGRWQSSAVIHTGN